VTKREWQIEMANRFAKRDNVKELEAKLECYERLVDSINMASNPMSVKSREALKNVREMKTIMTKEALAQPEQEPVAWMDKDGDVLSASVIDGNGLRNIPLYTTPPQRTWVGLTDEELQPIADEYRILFGGWVKDFARVIEDKLKDKNT
jgi:hypothetical protein